MHCSETMLDAKIIRHYPVAICTLRHLWTSSLCNFPSSNAITCNTFSYNASNAFSKNASNVLSFHTPNSILQFTRLPIFSLQSQFCFVWPESQKTRQRVSNADRKVFANPEVFCDKFIIGWRISGYFAIQNIQIICKVSGWTGKFLDNLKCVRII